MTGVMSYGSADAIVAACQAETKVTDPLGTIHLLAGHDFAQFNNHFELRVLGEFGSGGKLRVEHRSSGWRVYADAYLEDEQSPGFPARVMERLNGALDVVAAGLVFEPAVACQQERSGVVHAILPGTVDEVDADFRPVACGGGVVFPGPLLVRVPECRDCRISLAVGAHRWVWLYELEMLLGELVGMRSFPKSRLDVAAAQRAFIVDGLARPRAAAMAANALGHRLFTGPGLRPSGLVEVFEAFTRWHLRVFEAHGAEHLSRFPRRAEVVAMIDRGRALFLSEGV